jgi:uncharacterized membrane protein
LGDKGNAWGWWKVLGTVMMVSFVAAIVWAVTARDRGVHPGERAEPSAREIPERRQADGELTSDEFEETRPRLMN